MAAGRPATRASRSRSPMRSVAGRRDWHRAAQSRTGATRAAIGAAVMAGNLTLTPILGAGLPPAGTRQLRLAHLTLNFNISDAESADMLPSAHYQPGLSL